MTHWCRCRSSESKMNPRRKFVGFISFKWRRVALGLLARVLIVTITATMAAINVGSSGAAAISPETYVSRAITLYNRGRYPEAIQLLKKALQVNPRYVRAWSWLGFTYVKIGRNQDALAAFKKVIELAPRSEDARIAQQWIAKLLSAKPPPGRRPSPSPLASPPPPKPPTPRPQTSSAPSPSSPAAAITPSPVPLAITPTGAVVSVAPNEPIIVAYWLAVTGPEAPLGIDSRRGIEIAVEDRRNVAGHPIRLLGEDARCDPEGGIVAATRIAANKQIVAAIGPSCSSGALAGAPVLWKSGIVTISPSNTSPILTEPDRSPGLLGYLRTSHNDKVQGIRAAEFSRIVLGVRTAATIDDGSRYTIVLDAAFSQAFRGNGGAVAVQEAVSPGDVDMRPILLRIALARPDLLYLPIFVRAGARVVRQARQIPELQNMKIVGADSLFSPEFLRAAGQAAIGVYLSSPEFSATAFGPRYREFRGRFQARYGNPPSVFHAHAYDAAMMIFEAIERIAKRDSTGGLLIFRDELRAALYATANFQGLTGTLTCSSYGDCADPKIAIFQVVSVDPTTWQPGVNPRRIFP